LLTLKSSNTHGISDTYTYDVLGEMRGAPESHICDAAENLKSKADFNGKTTTYACNRGQTDLAFLSAAIHASPRVSVAP